MACILFQCYPHPLYAKLLFMAVLDILVCYQAFSQPPLAIEVTIVYLRSDFDDCPQSLLTLFIPIKHRLNFQATRRVLDYQFNPGSMDTFKPYDRCSTSQDLFVFGSSCVPVASHVISALWSKHPDELAGDRFPAYIVARGRAGGSRSASAMIHETSMTLPVWTRIQWFISIPFNEQGLASSLIIEASKMTLCPHTFTYLRTNFIH